MAMHAHVPLPVRRRCRATHIALQAAAAAALTLTCQQPLALAAATRSSLTGGTVTAATGVVSFWYYPPAYGGEDINATIAMLKAHPGVTTSVMLGCGHEVTPTGGINTPPARSQDLCTETVAGLVSAKVKPELVLGGDDVAQLRLFFQNATANIEALLAIGKRFGATGWNLDLEPTSSVASDATLYATFLGLAKPKLNAAGMRLTIATATWSPMLSNTKLLAPHVDRVLDMETYNADSMSGWLSGDAVGGYYSRFVAPPTARAKLGPGLGCWPAKCGPKNASHLCWSATAASGPPRLARIIADGLPEVALFRIVQVPGRPDLQWPHGWWWPLLAEFASTRRRSGLGPGLPPKHASATVD